MNRITMDAKGMFQTGILFSFFFLMCGCQSSQKYSGFLDDYSILKPNPTINNALYYQDPDKSLADYNKFIIDPILIHFHPSSKAKSIDPEKLLELTTEFRNEVVQIISEDYEVVNTPGVGVLRIQAAITDLEENSPLFNIHPGTKLLGVGLGGAAMEAKALDSLSGELVIAVMDARQGERISLDISAGLTTWGSAKQAARYWANRFIDRLDEVHGK